MKTLKITFITLCVITFGILNSHCEEEPKASIESASPEQFELLLAKVKSLHSKGEATYFSSDLDIDWVFFKPFLIVVRHNNVEIFLNSDLTAPILLTFIRGTGVWTQHNSRWTVYLKKAGEDKPSELWSRTNRISDQEIEQARKYTEYQDLIKKQNRVGGRF